MSVLAVDVGVEHCTRERSSYLSDRASDDSTIPTNSASNSGRQTFDITQTLFDLIAVQSVNWYRSLIERRAPRQTHDRR
jgi:hypothetical protein